MIPRPWHKHASQEFIKAATVYLGDSQGNTADCYKLHREVRASLFAIELRYNRVRQWRGPIFRAAADIAANPYQSFQWATLVSGPLEQIAKEADQRLRSWK